MRKVGFRFRLAVPWELVLPFLFMMGMIALSGPAHLGGCLYEPGQSWWNVCLP